jgi:hypothetical protein
LAGAVTKEQAVKAGIIFNITKFVVWPSDAREQFNLCVFGDDQLEGALEALYGKRIANKKLALRRNMPDKLLTECHIAFIGKQKDKDMQKVLQKLKSMPVLTISDNPNFIDQGGMVGFVKDGRRVGFEFNLVHIRTAGLNIGSQLLKLAKRVKGLK